MPKFNVNFSESVYNLLASIALDRGQTMADVLRDEVSRAAWMDDELRHGHAFLIDRKGKVTELVFTHTALLRSVRPDVASDLQAPDVKVGHGDEHEWNDGPLLERMNSSDPNEAARAAFSLGRYRAEHGDMSGAEEAYQRAWDSGHPDIAAKSALILGSFRAHRGDRAGASVAYDWVATHSSNLAEEARRERRKLGVGPSVEVPGDAQARAAAQAARRRTVNARHHGD